MVLGMRYAGEPVLAGAVRMLRQAGLRDVEPWAVDLSARVALLAVDVPDEQDVDHLPVDAGPQAARAAAIPDVRLAFRSLTRADLPAVVAWTTAPHVRPWWPGEAATLDAAERHYGPALDGADPTRLWVVEVNGRSAGLLQDYRVGDHPEYALLTARPDAVGLDYLVGDPRWVGRGVGTRLLWQFLREVVRPGYPEAREYFAAPDHRNTVSLRVLDKLGFQRGLWFDEPQRDGGVSTVVGCTLDVAEVFGRPPDEGAG